MKQLICLLLLVCATSTLAADRRERLLYWLIETKGHAEISTTTDVFDMIDRRGALSKFGCHNANAWKAAIPEADRPTLAQLDALDGATVDAWIASRDEDKQAPDTGWSNLSRRERFLIRCLWRLAKEHYPSLTLEQFRTQLRDEWNATPENE